METLITYYKLLTRAIANRIYKILPNLISEDQTGYIKGRYTGFNIRKIEECIQFLEINKKKGLILNIDVEKAFDSLE